jgi:hypothetical protein
MAADSVLFIGWNRPIAGREKAALDLFTYSMGYWNDLKSSGQIASFEPVLLAAHGGGLNGFIVIKGEQAKLDAVRNSDKFLDLITKVSINVDNVGVIPGWSGELLMNQMQRYGNLLG